MLVKCPAWALGITPTSSAHSQLWRHLPASILESFDQSMHLCSFPSKREFLFVVDTMMNRNEKMSSKMVLKWTSCLSPVNNIALLLSTISSGISRAQAFQCPSELPPDTGKGAETLLTCSLSQPCYFNCPHKN